MVLLGFGLAVLGVIGYIAQVGSQRLFTPWYMPVAATVGMLFILLSLWKARSIWRVGALLFVVLLAGAGWAMILGTRLPAYAGPVSAGQAFPAFATARANGTPFTQRDLQGDQNSVLVFFRGRW